ncbi:MAG: cytochrome c, partial [Methyloversatilis sp.]|nr:cytochrome c [Methyloversatilis sp.]
ELFGRNCQQCHNSRGKGGKGPQLVKGAWGPGGANSDGYMYGIIANGRPNTQMGGFGPALKPEEIWQIIAFLREEAKRVKAAEKAKAGAEDDLWF